MPKRIGDFLRDQGLLNEAQVQQTLAHSEKTGLRFGEAAVDLGLITTDDLASVFGPHYDVDFFHVEPEYFPASSRNTLPIEVMLERGVIPLGFKSESSILGPKRSLNLGYLEPSPEHVRSTHEWALSFLKDKGIFSTRSFLILADHFLKVLEQVYGMDEQKIRAQFSPEKLHPTLRLYLEV